jgi:hypothetical protein
MRGVVLEYTMRKAKISLVMTGGLHYLNLEHFEHETGVLPATIAMS